jgi:hypothetical protein
VDGLHVNRDAARNYRPKATPADVVGFGIIERMNPRSTWLARGLGAPRAREIDFSDSVPRWPTASFVTESPKSTSRAQGADLFHWIRNIYLNFSLPNSIPGTAGR